MFKKIISITKKPKFKCYTILFLFTLAAILLYTTYSPINFSSPLLGKVDDWQFSSETYDPFYNLNPETIIRKFTFKKILLLISLVPLLALIPFNIVYLTYRFFGFIVRRFRKYLSFGTRKKVFESIGFLFLGTIIATGTAYLAIAEGLQSLAIYGAFILTGVLTFICGFVSSIYFLVILCKVIIRKLRKSSAFGLKRKLMWSLSAAFPTGIVIIWIVLNVIEIYFGTDLFGALEISPVAGPSGYGSSTGAFNLSPGGISNPSLPAAGGGLFGPSYKSDHIGFSTGGAKDINNFRENIKNNYLPLFTDVTYEGLFYDYYFDTGQQEECLELFCPSYRYAITKDPISDKKEYYLSVGLNSGIRKEDFARKKLNLVIVLDISGSMSSNFNSYYYDQFVNPSKENSEDRTKPKMQVASESVVALLDHLSTQDRYGMVLFDEKSYLAKPMRMVETTDIESLKGHILELRPQGGTNMEAGYKEGTKILEEYINSDSEEYENRIIFLTDAQPNTGVISEEGLVGMTKSNADRGIYTTFIGIGVDFNTELIEAMTKIRGANYYSVHSASDFKYRMDEGFDYMVTPLVFDLVLKLNTSDFIIDKVYGSPLADLATGEIMNVNTLFPSDSTDEGVKGGIVILKLSKIADSKRAVNLEVSYKDRSYQSYVNNNSGALIESEEDFFQNSGIRKGILLARYANLIKNWIKDERMASENKNVVPIASVSTESGIIIPEVIEFSPWERTSLRLQVSEDYKPIFTQFRDHFVSEASYLDDNSLNKETEVLDMLINY